MFGYLRVFILVSLISVVIIAVMVGFYLRSLSKNDLIALSENQNNLLINTYIQSVWKPHSYPPPSVEDLRNAALIERKKELFESKSRDFIREIGASYFTIYNQSATPIYQHQDYTTSITAMARWIGELAARQDKIISELISQPTEHGRSRRILKTVRPLGQATAAQQYYVEVHTDVTEEYNKVILLQWVASGSIIIVFLMLMWILIQTSKRAENIIARQHESNMELAAKAAVAEAENKQKSMFLANVSHELRTPLNAIIGFSDIIRHEMTVEAQNERYGSYVHDIHSAGVHLLSLINDILDFTKAEAGKLEVEITEINLNKLVKNCLRLVSPRAEEAGVKLIDALPKEVLTLATDNKKLKQVLLNLLSNAVKFTEAEGEVRVSAWRNLREDSIGFEVKDSGIGMAPKDISRAMSPFGQVDSALSRKYEGTGLGLPLTKKFVELMGGEFKIESEEGRGTIITVTLPVSFGEQSDMDHIEQ